ncbi:RNA-binding S4 domain-containing protein [Sphingorhabdus sp.]|jgi:ribosome-associated heat shock protein Hsp15|uniref:RNA-binding S4 domain-containing protein n=1 Tax=Sphingorhabdus sp. TaxID=1902408 RepID=UPI003BAEF719|nr:RNA-binding S4 domain-containing protein [Sphingomonadales bacterium]MBK9433413.1 RNA-binding S4 domain-containing protein [Sphingomonadales bacterium]MBL0020945.1 RNA-binding S4 domain-containing protein [Sphingomonadales bacterium]
MASASASLRIDKCLWFLRFAKSRTLAQLRVEGGHIRKNGKRIEKASETVQVGDVITLPVADGAVSIRILALPTRRGPPAEAQGCYENLS